MKRDCQAVYYACDIIVLDSDLRELPLLERKKILRKIIRENRRGLDA